MSVMIDAPGNGEQVYESLSRGQHLPRMTGPCQECLIHPDDGAVRMRQQISAGRIVEQLFGARFE